MKYTFTSRINGREETWVRAADPGEGIHRAPDSAGGRLIQVWFTGKVDMAFHSHDGE